MCRNAMCPNFGVHYDGGGDSGRRGKRYRVNLKDGRAECVFCGLSFQLHSNQAIRPLARHFLSLSLPFADCPRPACANHGFNAFEQADRYRSNGGRQVVCRGCRSRFCLGEALHLRRDLASRRLLGQVLDSVGRRSGTVTGVRESTRMGVGGYYSRLLRAAARLRDYAAWRNAGMLREQFEEHTAPVRVQTDVLQATLQRSGDKPGEGRTGHQHLNVFASVLVLPDERTYFALAAHPAFLPGRLCPNLDELSADGGSPVHAKRWDCIAHALDIDLSKPPSAALALLPDIGRNGCFAKAPYAELAHFLVVRKLLSRFRCVHYCMDGDRALAKAASVALSPDVLAGRAEIALFQHDKQGRAKGAPASGGRSGRRKGRRLDAALGSLAKRVEGRMNPKGLAEAAPDRKVRARTFKSALRGAYSQAGEWAWLAHPNPAGRYVNPKALWLTQTPGRDVQEGRDLFAHATLQSVDSLFNSMRSRVASLGRPGHRAASGRGFRDRYVNVAVVSAELWVYLLLRNYAPRVTANQGIAPARALKLMKGSEGHPDPLDVALSFRLGWEQAQRMTKWVRR